MRSSSTPAPKLALSTRVLVSGKDASLHVTCAGSECRGTLELVKRIATHHGRVLAHTTVVLGRGSFRLAGGAGSSIRLHLTSAGIERLAHAAQHEVSGKLNYDLRGGQSGTQAVMVR